MKDPSSPSEILSYLSPQISQFVQGKGWHCTEGEYSGSSFGNAFVDIDAGEFELRLIKDHGAFFAEVKRRGRSSSHDLAVVLIFLGVISADAELSSSVKQILMLVSVLSNNIEAVSELLRDDRLETSGFLAYEMKNNSESLERLREKARSVRNSKP